MNDTNPTIIPVVIEPCAVEVPDYLYLRFVDKDVRDIFAGKGGYFLSDILSMQIIKELRKLNASKENLK